MSEKKQSSVILIRNWVRTNGEMSQDGQSITYSCKDIEAIIDQAKIMHKSEMAKTWDSALDAGQERAWNVMRAYSDFDEYYENTFKNNNQ